MLKDERLLKYGAAMNQQRRLLYVTCSRAEKELAIIMHTDKADALKNNLEAEGSIFKSDEIIYL